MRQTLISALPCSTRHQMQHPPLSAASTPAGGAASDDHDSSALLLHGAGQVMALTTERPWDTSHPLADTLQPLFHGEVGYHAHGRLCATGVFGNLCHVLQAWSHKSASKCTVFSYVSAVLSGMAATSLRAAELEIMGC